MRQLLFNERAKKYFLLDNTQDIVCDVCGKYADEFIHIRHSKGTQICDRVFCSKKCAETDKLFLSKIGEIKVVIPTTEFIEGSIFVPERPLELCNGEISVFDVALSNKGIKSDSSSCKVINNCKVAFNPERNIQKIETAKQDETPVIDWANMKRKKRIDIK
jgi:hypothetical protein